jgi:DivIVA domain-containing protein
MGIINGLTAWALIVLALCTASGPLRQLAQARRSRARLRATAESTWTRLVLSLAWLIIGVNRLFNGQPLWLGLILLVVATAGMATVAVPGILSRRRAGVTWWRFWVPVVPPESDADSINPADAFTSRPTIVLDEWALDLIVRIESATFGTTRFSPGYNEEEVDDFLDKIVAVLGTAGQPDQGELAGVRFSTTWLRPGYVQEDVSALLREVAQAAPV